MKRNKILKKFVLASIAPIAIVPIVTSASGSFYKTGEIYFQGRKFKNAEEALKYLVQKKSIDIGTSKVLGNVNRSYINMESGLLNKELLPNYDVSKMHLAYNTAGGGLTPDYQRAKKTYFNKGMILKRYDDGYGGSFLSSHEASNSMRNKTIESKLMYTTVDYIAEGGSSLKKKINPFSTEDINNYKENIKNHIFDILAQNIEGKQDKYEVVIENTGEISGEVMKRLNTKQFLPKSLKKTNEWTVSEDENKITHSMPNQQIRSWFGTTNKTMVYGGTISGHTWGDFGFGNNNNFTLTASRGGKFYWPKNILNIHDDPDDVKNPAKAKDKFSQILNVNTITWNNNKKWNVVRNNGIVDRKNIYSDNALLKTQLENQLKNIDGFNLEWKKDKKPSIFKNKKLANSIWKEINNKNLFGISGNKDKYSVTLPTLDVTNSSAGSIFHKTYSSKIEGRSYTFNYDYQKDYTIGLKRGSLNNELINALLNLDNKEMKFKIKRKGSNDEIFRVNMKMKDGAINTTVNYFNDTKNNLFKKPNSDESNNKWFNDEKEHIFDPKTLINSQAGSSNLNIEKWFYGLLNHLHTDLYDENNGLKLKNKDAIQSIFKKYFNDPKKYFGSVKNNLHFKYDVDFVNSDPKKGEDIEYKDAIKFYVNIINEAYEKYQHYPKLLKKIASKIINPANILWLKDKTNQLHLGKYIMKSIIDFNAPVSNGTFVSEDILATTRMQWSITKNNVDFNPALLIIVYDQNGERVNSDDYEYDNETILEFNSRLTAEPRRNFEWIFVDGHHGPVANITTTIQYVLVNDQKLYFRTFYQLKAFMINFIRGHSIQI